MYYAQRIPYITISISNAEFDLATSKCVDNNINLQMFLRFCSIKKVVDVILPKYEDIERTTGSKIRQYNIRLQKQEYKDTFKSIFEDINISITNYYRFCIFNDNAFNLILKSYRKFKKEI